VLLLFFIPMRRIVYIISFLASVVISSAQEFKFEKKIIKLDKVKAGENLNFSYPFTNTGDQPIIINNIKVSCNCTKTEWPKNPILPGISDTIHVSVSTKSMVGWQDRILEIHSNSLNTPDKIRFKVMVDNPAAKKK